METDRHVTRAKSDLDLSHGRVCFHPASQGILKADLHGTIFAYDCRMRFL